MAGFHPPDAYIASRPLTLLPFRFESRGDGNYLVSNMVGDFVHLSRDELERLIELQVKPSDGLYERAFAAHLLAPEGETAQQQLLATRLRTRMAFLREPTGLHIFVVTLRCEHSCPYCQVSRQSTDKSRYDMSEQTAEQALR